MLTVVMQQISDYPGGLAVISSNFNRLVCFHAVTEHIVMHGLELQPYNLL